jgi:hypothetical protein
MTSYTLARDLAKYRHNTRWWMRQHRRILTVAVAQPEWLRRQSAKILSGPTESEMRAAWGDR